MFVLYLAYTQAHLRGSIAGREERASYCARASACGQYRPVTKSAANPRSSPALHLRLQQSQGWQHAGRTHP